MEFLFYLLGNWIVSGGAVYLLFNAYKHSLRDGNCRDGNWSSVKETKQELLISYDLQVMLLIGALARVYWSFSPPVVYHAETPFVQWLSVLDILHAPLLWIAVVFFVGLKQTKYTSSDTPTKWRWPSLSFAALILGYLWSHVLPSVDIAGSFPFQDVVVMFNMIGEGLAIVPQMHLIRYSKEPASREASHFVGMLCLGRCFRVMFWLAVIVMHGVRGVENGPHIWSFIIPDLLHTVIMGDYLLIWLEKVRRDHTSLDRASSCLIVEHV